MHEIYRTRGIVLGKREFGEADRFIYILTEEFGLVSVIAKGVRNIKSKMRHNLDLFTAGNFCLVRGKDAWRLVDAECETSVFPPSACACCCKPASLAPSGSERVPKQTFLTPWDEIVLPLLGRLATFLIRMINGEERNDFIWKRITHLMDFLKNHENINSEEAAEMEENVVAEILHNLGYMESVPKSRKLLIPAINRAIKESML